MSIFVFFFVSLCTVLTVGDEKTIKLPANMPSVHPDKPDTYLCSAHRLPEKKHFIVGYEPHASQETAHHLLMYGCSAPHYTTSSSWNCGEMGGTCSGTSEIVFAWAKNAPGFDLPKGVGFAVGGSSGIKYIVLQIHYKHAFRKGVTDSSGVTLLLTPTPQPFLASIYLFASFGKDINGGVSRTEVNLACKYFGRPMHPFAFRVHAHNLGKRIMAYRIRDGNWTKIALGSPQNPQAFYPIENGPVIHRDDTLAARCVFDSTGRDKTTYFGMTGEDEMCNFYMMFYTSADGADVLYSECYSDGDQTWKSFPYDDAALDYDDVIAGPPTERDVNPLTATNFDWESEATGNENRDDLVDDGAALADVAESADRNFSAPSSDSLHLEMQVWPSGDIGSGRVVLPDGNSLGQVGGVSVSTSGRVYVFHRASRVWDYSSFDFEDVFQQRDDGPVADPTIAVLDSTDGRVVETWGSNRFYLPHGITVDFDGNVWLTDVAMHQVFKFEDEKTAALTLGEAFVPGSDPSHFCKPADVAVLSDGRFFVADGYCNSRIVRFNADGTYDTEWKAAGTGSALPTVGLKGSQSFSVVHALTVSEDLDVLCAADRENRRILCYNYETGKLLAQISGDESGDRIFSVAFSPTSSNLFAIAQGTSTTGYTLDSQYRVVDEWNSDPGMVEPHTLAVADDGSVYVGEIGPNRVWKFQSSLSSSVAEGTARALTATSAASRNSTAVEANTTSSVDAVVGSVTASAASPVLQTLPASSSQNSLSAASPTEVESLRPSLSSSLASAGSIRSTPRGKTVESHSGFHPSILPVVLICSLVTVPVLLLLIVGIACRKKSKLSKHLYQPLHSQDNVE